MSEVVYARFIREYKIPFGINWAISFDGLEHPDAEPLIIIPGNAPKFYTIMSGVPHSGTTTIVKVLRDNIEYVALFAKYGNHTSLRKIEPAYLYPHINDPSEQCHNLV